MLSASFSVIRPFSNALFFNISTSRPLPSSSIWITIWLPSLYAFNEIVPVSSLPAAKRTSGVSIPWSQEFLIMWTSGSPISSTIDLSSSVSSPSISNSIFLFNSLVKSRIILGNLLNTFPIGSILVFITAIWRSVVTRETIDTTWFNSSKNSSPS